MPAEESKLLTALAIGAALAISGCGTSSGDGMTSRTSTMAAEAPTTFNPCTDIPKEALDSEKLKLPNPDDFQAGGVKWKGCVWAQSDGYAVSIQTTNLTLAMVHEKNFPSSKEFVIQGRPAITSRQSKIDTEWSCTLNAEINGGSLQFSLTNSPSADRTGHLDSCDLAKSLAEKVIPSIPADT